MDSGKDVYTLMQEIKLPATYNLSEVFGKVSWSVRGIYDGYAGWYDGNPSSMYELPPFSVYPDLVNLAGGPDRVVQLAFEKLRAGQPVEALHLTDVALASDPKNEAALNARIKALESLRELRRGRLAAIRDSNGERNTGHEIMLGLESEWPRFESSTWSTG
jgi:alkyl sulfatase BDS1-like metallo-beta-lactamase superfamily hydrolase